MHTRTHTHIHIHTHTHTHTHTIDSAGAASRRVYDLPEASSVLVDDEDEDVWSDEADDEVCLVCVRKVCVCLCVYVCVCVLDANSLTDARASHY